MPTVAILGGGISGLSAAYYLSKLPNSPFSKVILLEASNHLGGWIKTSRFDDGTVFEHGPRSIRGVGKGGPNTLKLVEELGLEKDVLPIPHSHPATRNRFIYVNNQLCQLPNGLMSVLKKSPPFSKSLARIGWKEPFRRSIKLHDETVYDFFKRRFSQELAEYAGDPVCRGIFAGDCRKLSVKSCFPEVFRLEQEYGSLIRGTLLRPKDKSNVDSALVQRYRKEDWAMWSLTKGLVELPIAMVAELRRDPRIDIQIDTPCEGINLSQDSAKVAYKGQEVEVDHVISAVLAKNLSTMVGSQHQPLAQDLLRIPVVSVAVVNLEYEGSVLPVQGFGHLIPSTEPCKVLGVLYESCIFEQHNQPGKPTTRITCMMGGAWFEEYFGNPDNCDKDELLHTAMTTVRDHLGIQQEPSKTLVHLQKECIPQYHIGHNDILDTMAQYISDKRLPLSLVGASFRGVSVNDCILNAKEEAHRVAALYM